MKIRRTFAAASATASGPARASAFAPVPGSVLALVLISSSLITGSSCAGSPCGPEAGVVQRVLDGDTVELEGGQLVRYLLVDAPELWRKSGGAECFAERSAQANVDLVLGQRVTLAYDVECRDDYDRLLAYVSVGAREVNALLVERGYACALHVPPNGAERASEMEALEARARAQERGLWGACAAKPCR